MTSQVQKLNKREQLNFLLTNRIPRRYLTFFVGWLSQIENPWLAKFLIWTMVFIRRRFAFNRCQKA
ncbi:hypothetical protein RS130_01210 [Paraglaciecola aquimarina]|uniref:Uncharacterized protein n=1 Tax=Paraglaciecola aquimarina TaxID=1235557 RepID=A0ABU3SRV7_9ALTE|nr:hypothetical protein [Paraglaciecola aquimarina]MDU0352716.1 hypothetical protein [Paraglaciecola aquimarina]